MGGFSTLLACPFIGVQCYKVAYFGKDDVILMLGGGGGVQIHEIKY